MLLDQYGPTGREMKLSDKLFEIDWGLVSLLALIACFGTAMLFSVEGGSWSPWAANHLLRFVFSVGVLIIVALIDIRIWMSLAYPIYFLALGLLIIVDLAGYTGKGATRWIDLGPLHLQPSEIMKIGIVLALARFLHVRPPGRVNHPLVLIVLLGAICAPVGLVLLQPDLGTSLLILAGGASILFLAGLHWGYIATGLVAGLGAIPLAWRVLHDYQKDRVLTFLDPSRDPMGAGYHILQSKIGFGSGGLTGKGYLNSSQARLDFLPEKQTDFIFTILGEEFGLMGALTLLILYSLVLYYCAMIAFSSRSVFGRLVAMGAAVTFFLYVGINTSMVIGLIPVVGIPLPLVSHGGTAMLTIMFAMGLVMSVHIHRSAELPRSVD